MDDQLDIDAAGAIHDRILKAISDMRDAISKGQHFLALYKAAATQAERATFRHHFAQSHGEWEDAHNVCQLARIDLRKLLDPPA